MISEQSLNMGQVVLPEGLQLALFNATSGELQRISQLPFSALDKFVANNEGWVVGISGSDVPSVKCWNAKAATDFLLPLPNMSFPDAVAFVGQILYIGGRTEERLPFLGLYDLGAQFPQWYSVQVPNVFVERGKSVDALLVDGSRLIVVDNVVYPSFLLVYDISEPLQPKLVTVEELQPHGTWEKVRDAVIGSNWIAILTTTDSGWSGSEQHIVLLDKNSLEERVVISTRRQSYEPGPYDWTDLVFWDNLLLIAAGMDGIGILDFSGIGDLGVDPEIIKKAFFFFSFPNTHDEEVTRIIPGRFAGRLGLVLKQNNSLRSMLISQQDLMDIQSREDRNPFEAIDRRNSEPGVA